MGHWCVCVCVCASVLCAAQRGASRTKNRSQIIDWHNVGNFFYWISIFVARTGLLFFADKDCCQSVQKISLEWSISSNHNMQRVHAKKRLCTNAVACKSVGNKTHFVWEKSCFLCAKKLCKRGLCPCKSSLCEQIGLSVFKSISL